MDWIYENLLLANTEKTLGNLKKKFFLPSSQKNLCSAYTEYTRNKTISPYSGPIKNFFLQNLTIYA
jgi:hypothetical protein